MNMQERRRQLGRNIRRAREARGISQRSFAQMVGMSQPYLSAVESGEKNIGYANLCKIADGLGIRVGQLTDADLGPWKISSPTIQYDSYDSSAPRSPNGQVDNSQPRANGPEPLRATRGQANQGAMSGA